jgi:hypothetical protein
VKGKDESKEEFRKKFEEWEQPAELALSIPRKSLGDYKGSIQNINDPLEAYERVKRLKEPNTMSSIS